MESEEALGVVPRKLRLAVLIGELSKKSYLRRVLDLAGPLGSNSLPCSGDNLGSSHILQETINTIGTTKNPGLMLQGASFCSIVETLTAFADQPMSCMQENRNGQLAFRHVLDTSTFSSGTVNG